MIAELLTVIAPVVICAAIGFLWSRRGEPFDVGQVTRISVTLGTPCLIVWTFEQTRPEPDVFLEIAAAITFAFVGFAALGYLALKLARLDVRNFLPALVFPNTGNMGLPLCFFAFGDAGLAFAIVIFTVSALGNFTFGASLARGSARLADLARMPALYAVPIGLLLIVGDLHLPAWIANTVELLAGLTIPLMLLALGVSLSRLSISSLWRSTALSLLRLVGGFAIGVLAAWIFGLEGTARGVLILQCSMPTAVFNYLFAERYGRAPSEVAGMVLVSTLLSFATLPLLLWYLL